MLISRYIQAMPSIGSTPELEEQKAIRGASLAAIPAISAKLGAAARPSHRVAWVLANIVIFGLLIDGRGFRPLPNRTGM
jgi:hypothetical protein